MSVKQMSTEQIRNDLDALNRMFPGGIPTEQYDRMNALKGELKRRGEEIVAPRAQQSQTVSSGALDSMNDDQLEAELRALSQRIGMNPKDEEAQERFANVRFEMRRRAKGGEVKKAIGEDQTQPARPPLPPRALEIPEESQPEVQLKQEATRPRGVVVIPLEMVETIVAALQGCIDKAKGEL